MEIEILEMGRVGEGQSSKFGERLKEKWGGGVLEPCLMDGILESTFAYGRGE